MDVRFDALNNHCGRAVIDAVPDERLRAVEQTWRVLVEFVASRNQTVDMTVAAEWALMTARLLGLSTHSRDPIAGVADIPRHAPTIAVRLGARWWVRTDRGLVRIPAHRIVATIGD